MAALIAAMGWGAGIGGSRPAAVALVALGVAVLAWALLVDLPVTDETGALGSSFEGAAAGQAGSRLDAGDRGRRSLAIAGARRSCRRTPARE